MTYRLSRKAEEDIIGIFLQGIELFGLTQAERYHRDLQRTFELIGRHPQMARERTEISPPVRIHPHGAHIIVYLADDAIDVLIVRVRRGHEDWEND